MMCICCGIYWLEHAVLLLCIHVKGHVVLLPALLELSGDRVEETSGTSRVGSPNTSKLFACYPQRRRLSYL
jgi:hypothetical protein